MTYNTQDGATVKVKDLRQQVKAQGDSLPPTNKGIISTVEKDKSAAKQRREKAKEKELNKTVAQYNKQLGKSQAVEMSKVTPQSKLRYNANEETLCVGPQNMLKNIVISENY